MRMSIYWKTISIISDLNRTCKMGEVGGRLTHHVLYGIRSLIGNMDMLCVGLYQINGENIQVHTVIRDSNNIRLFHNSVV